MRLIKEAKNVGSDVYERTVGVTCNLHELVEAMEYTDDCQIGGGNEEYYVPSVVEYEVFVGDKAVDPSKVKISMYDGEGYRSDFWVCEASGDELETGQLNEAENLAKMSKEELIRKVFELQGR